MPIIPLRPEIIEAPERLDLDQIGAVMCWPNDATLRRHALGAAIAAHNATVADDPALTQRPELMAAAMKHAATAEPARNIESAASKCMKHGTIAGQIVRFAIARHATGENNTLREIKRDLAKHWKLSTSSIENTIWKPYRPVAHFWAAYVGLVAQRGKAAGFPCQLGELPLFLAWAFMDLKVGSTIRAEKSHPRLLDPDTAWKIPTAIRLPKLTQEDRPPLVSEKRDRSKSE